MLNKCCFIGHLGKDPEVRSTQAGKEIVNLSLAVTEKWKDQSGERKERTEWVRAVIFNDGLVKVAKSYLKKGSKIYLEGQMATRKWTDQSGVEKYSTEIVLSAYGGVIVMLDSKGADDGKAANAERPATASALLDDEVPF